jgi:hypothetical protein
MAVYSNSVHNTGAGYTLVGIFKEVEPAEQAIVNLRGAGFSPDAIMLVTTNEDEQGEVDETSYGKAKRREGLDKIGIPASDRKNYEELIANGNSLVVVNLDDQGLMPTARDIIESNGTGAVRFYDNSPKTA